MGCAKSLSFKGLLNHWPSPLFAELERTNPINLVYFDTPILIILIYAYSVNKVFSKDLFVII